MNERIVEEHRRHQLLSTLHAGKYKGRVWKEKELLCELEGESAADVQTKLKAFVDARFVEAAAKQVGATTEAYVKAFRSMLGDLTDGRHAMIKAHYLAQNRCMTATQLAKAAGYSSYGAAVSAIRDRWKDVVRGTAHGYSQKGRRYANLHFHVGGGGGQGTARGTMDVANATGGG